MTKILKVLKREYLASVKTKGFIIGLVIAPILMGGSMIAFLLLKDHVDTTDKKLIIIDRSGQVAEYILDYAARRNEQVVYDQETGEKIRPAYLIESIEPDQSDPLKQRLELSDRIRRGEIYAFVDIGSDVVHPGEIPENNRIGYYSENSAIDEIRGWIRQPINDRLRFIRLDDAGISESDVKDLFYWINVTGLDLVSVDDSGEIQEGEQANELQAIFVPMMIMMMMFMMAMMGAIPLLNSVMEEKTQRIAEVMLGSINPFEFMMGKVLGGVAVSLTSAAVYVILGAITFNFMEMSSIIPSRVLPWFFTYMILNVFMIGSIMAGLGAACSDAKDAQNMSLPAMLPLIIPMFIWFIVVREPLGSLATGLSLIPFFTPMLMMIRLATPATIPLWQPWVGLAGIMIFAVLSVWIGGRIFRIAILIQGKTKFGKIFKLALRG